MRRRAPRFLIATFVVVAVGCGATETDRNGASSTSLAVDPWAEDAAGILEECAENADDDSATDDYCRCVLNEVIEFYGTPEAFAAAGAPRVGDLASSEPRLQPAVAGCADAHLS